MKDRDRRWEAEWAAEASEYLSGVQMKWTRDSLRNGLQV